MSKTKEFSEGPQNEDYNFLSEFEQWANDTEKDLEESDKFINKHRILNQQHQNNIIETHKWMRKHGIEPSYS
ncbi:hypothetical protein HON22_01895 [Candidatus Peregrinibacteria bacterium]|jgi:hypothetical protein|nr:hypothetical protein [Candidatus Peregrinibacteria bacterium]